MKRTVILTAALLGILSPGSFAKPLKVFILAGKSNMEGQRSVDLNGEGDNNGSKGNLVSSMTHLKSADKIKILKNEKGEWTVRDDVRISFKVGDKVLKCVRSRKDPYFPFDIGHSISTVCQMANIAIRLGYKLKWDPVTEQFIGDNAVIAMMDLPRHDPWQLQEVPEIIHLTTITAIIRNTIRRLPGTVE